MPASTIPEKFNKHIWRKRQKCTGTISEKSDEQNWKRVQKS